MTNAAKLTTLINRDLDNHIYFNGGSKTVCVSTCLNFFGIRPDMYNYTSSKKNVRAYENVLRRFGYSVRSRQSEFKASKGLTFSALRVNVKKSGYTANDFFIVHVVQSTKAHLIVIDGTGAVIIDTAPTRRWRVAKVAIVEKS